MLPLLPGGSSAAANNPTELPFIAVKFTSWDFVDQPAAVGMPSIGDRVYDVAGVYQFQNELLTFNAGIVNELVP